MTLLETEGTAYLDSENGTYWAHKEQQELIFLSVKWENAVDRLMGIAYQYTTGDFSSKPISRIHTLKLKD